MLLSNIIPSLSLFLTVSTSVSAQSKSNHSSETVNVKWLGRTPKWQPGTTFSLPWSRGNHYPNSTHFSSSGDGQLQTWPTAYWPDGSLKWTAHAIPQSDVVHDAYTITAASGTPSEGTGLSISNSADAITVDTGKTRAVFPKTGNAIISNITTATGKTVGQNGKLVLYSQSNSDAANATFFGFQSNIENVTVSQPSSGVRALVTVRGKHHTEEGHEDWLPFIARFYLYASSESIRLVHSIIFDGEPGENFITGIGVRFDVPLVGEELYNRHVRVAGDEGGMLSEAVKGITGLRRDPGEEVRAAQFEGRETPGLDMWDNRTSTRLQWIPDWNDYSLTQLSPEGFNLKKRTKAGQSWVKIPGASRSGGLAYLGGATQGGLAVGLRDFWKRYPAGLDIRNAAADVGEITVWVYSPAAEPLDLRPYHDGLGLDTYEKQLDALEITYEDWEEGFDTPHGIARTNELFIYAFDATPSQEHLADLTEYTNNPPVLFADSEHIRETKALGTYWAPANSTAESAVEIESHLDFLIKFYQGQVEQRRWYGFLDYGDFMHAYDEDRHTWRYDIGGSFLLNYFLRTGREDIYRFSEALTRHVSEVDVYHLGAFRGLGTRHGVQHRGDSAKQARISTAQYRKIFYFISGGDERVGELVEETLDTDQTYAILDPNRKVRTDGFVPSPNSPVAIGLGTDWSALAASWLLEWERRGPRWEEAKNKLTNTLVGIASLKNGFVTGSGLYNPTNGSLGPPPEDPTNNGTVAVSHLSAVFGLMEVIAELAEHYGDDLPAGFEDVWLDYCIYYTASDAEKIARYGKTWAINLQQGHSRLLAYAADRLQNSTLAERAWSDFFDEGDNGFNDVTATWTSERLDGSQVLTPIDEAAWLSTNNAANYGLAAIVNLALIGASIL